VPAVVETDEARTRSLIEPASAELRRRQRAEWGGIDWGAVFFGWVVAVGIGSLAAGLGIAVGEAIAPGEIQADELALDEVDRVTVAGAIAVVVVAMVSYFAGGYVAGRMSRFDGAYQGIAMWSFALLVFAGLAFAGLLAGGEYDVVGRVDFPAVLVATPLLTLLAAVAGGLRGERYHRAVDRTGLRA